MKESANQMAVQFLRLVCTILLYFTVPNYALFNMVLVYFDWCQRPYFGASTLFCTDKGDWIGPSLPYWLPVLAAETFLNYALTFGGVVWLFNLYIPGIGCFLEYIYLLKLYVNFIRNNYLAIMLPVEILCN